MRRYQRVIQVIKRQIESGILKPGAQVPSIRSMSLQTGYSAVTVHHAYIELESEGILRARPRSGFYVTEKIRKLADFPPNESIFDGYQSNRPLSLETAFCEISLAWQNKNIQNFSSMHVSDDLLTSKELASLFLKEMRKSLANSTSTKKLQCERELCETLAKRLFLRGMTVRPKEILIARSARYCLDLCLEVVTSPGDTVLVETPSYPALFAALRRRQLNVVEIYSHPNYGIDPDQFDYLMDTNDIKVCALMPTHHFPTGVSSPIYTLQRMLSKAASKKATIIENDTYGELSHDVGTRKTLYELDENGIVLQIGTFEEFLGSRFGLSWILTRNHYAKIYEANFFSDPLADQVALQSALAEFVSKRGYDRHLRRLRENLSSRVRQGLNLISQKFPQDCAVSRPDGGFTCWIRAPTEFDAMEATREALEKNFGYLPGPIFSATNSFKNFFALNLSFEWNSPQVQKLNALADLLNAQSRKKLRR